MMLPAFPQFKKLTLDDKNQYNALVAEYPPFSDISFTNLHIWWDMDGQLAASTINGNLVLNYSLPFDKEHSGYGLIGTRAIDESIQTIFKYLGEQNRSLKLVNVPEFTVEQIKNQADYEIEEEADFHEYIMSSQQLADLTGHDHSRTRRKVQRFLREVEGHSVIIQPLGLDSERVRDNVIKIVKSWHDKYPSQNDPERLEERALVNTLAYSQHLDTQSLGIFIDNQIHALALFHLTPDNNHYIINHLKVDYHYPFIFDYLTNQIAVYAVKHGVEFLNMEMDLGMEGLRRHKMGLRPVKFYKKYAIKPKP